ncbi:hypothetical protein IMG5_114130 [Ichthyophthirius multifiliis]|uniref:Uncharacterized protein n=1 Tax=Ichthyophthirius multifiliis TaxID=5932 RepID=G0QU17_ICHMU|nr:hypothetical protein IMG5_114130 [Ichthyophthirius multifiliis]EGR31284.1 hypothetical protein IMG5_114130 [Ichthyophthirius multifiliis]|eukprot:XP_004034770.1 hypothetical protein IMG5_114130 [Ichthyophthirius multifiliis]
MEEQNFENKIWIINRFIIADQDEMARQAALMEEKLKKMGKKKPLVKQDKEKKVFDSADYYKEQEEGGKS